MPTPLTTIVGPELPAPSVLIVIPLMRSELTGRSGRSAAIVHEREALPV